MENKYYFIDIIFNEKDFEKGNLLPNVLLDKFQTIASMHAQSLGVGFDDMLAKNLLWITMRIKYKILCQPKPNEGLLLFTYPQAKNNVEFDRDYEIKSQDGKTLIIATSKWCLLDATTRRLARMTNVDVPIAQGKESLFCEKFLKTETFIPSGKPNFSYRVSEKDIDKNDHMNNTVYAKLAFDALEKGVFIKQFQINFLHEAMLGNTLDVFVKKEENNFVIVGTLGDNVISFSALVKQ